ncbi:hypothetical protein E2P86_12625 [Sphingobacterium psychroaquaticum]|uniref:hypothetical protein n=1 Tax=Sphingobacterium psychroaquaticum TaxID=561061 RepID=UPI00106B429D|nr:hypothetical protein [Sphingobacterium psychroaquaticum]QBQ41949.1 hypothetical protein E2P86_12625 [Sphingobacterium psychroaquaticum]
MERTESFYFSYNSNLLDTEKIVDTKPFDGLLIDYLEKLLGEKFSFKETESHVIITYAPQRMDVSVEVEPTSNRAMVMGYVRDIRTKEGIPHASIYDRVAFQTSTLSDKNGYFVLDLKKADHILAIGLSKENYRDTSIMLLLPIDAVKNLKGRKLGYYARQDSSRTVYDSYFGHFFTSSAQRLQSLNLGGVFAYSPFQMSLTPGLSTHGFFNSQIVNTFSLNLIGGATAGVDGTELAGGFNVNQYDMRGAQFAGVINVVGGNVKGFQLAGGGNVVMNDVEGVQIGGVWNLADTVHHGIQLSGGFNGAKTSYGSQIAGVHNLSRNEVAVQITGGVNIAKVVKGAQLAGVLNVSRKEVVSQLAGGINIAKKVKGVQLAGVLNIADSSDYPIALLSLVKNGTKQLSVHIDDSKLVALNFRSGGRVLYSVLGFGLYVDDPIMKYAAEFGLGARLIHTSKFSFSTELVQRTNFADNFRTTDNNRVSLRFMPAMYLSKHLQVFAAPSFNYAQALEQESGAGTAWRFWGASRTRNSFHGGGTVGINYVFN